LGDTSKYDLFMSEIDSLEKVIQKFAIESEVIEKEKSALEVKVDNLEKENEILVLKIKEMEKKFSKVEGKSSAITGKTNLDLSERENLKDQIDDLISRIDYHIRS